jgi:crotonobetaine/carnitine-CoA ligase
VSLPDAAQRRTVGAMLRHNAEVFGNRSFLLDESGTLTWADAWRRAQEVAGGLAALGIRDGDRVILALGNRREFIEAWFGLALLGGVQVPFDPRAGHRRLHQVVAMSGASVAITDERLLPALVSEAQLSTIVTVDARTTVGNTTLAGFDSLKGEWGGTGEVAAEQPVAIMFTSGTTGRPKGVVLPHGQHWTNGQQAVVAAGITCNDVIFLCLPLHHNMAQGYGIWPALHSGASVRLVDRFDREAFWAQVRASQATVLPFVGDLIAILALAPPAADDADNPLRVGYGVPIPAPLHEDFERRYAIELIHAYGSTEATIPVWAAGADRLIGSVGRAVDGFDVEIRDDNGRRQPPGVRGEITIRAHAPNMIFSEYFNDPERTAVAMADGWFRTSDEGSFDDDGHLFFHGRRGDLIRHHGEFVSPVELESAALAHPDIAAAAAFGVPSELADDDIMLTVELREGATVDAEEMRTWLTQRVAPYVVPRYVDLAGALPVTDTGKIEKYKLKARGVTATTDDRRRPTGAQ